MIKKALEFIKKVVLSFAILYTYNLIAVNFNMVIPINIITVSLIVFFGVPSLIALILFRIVII